MKAALIQAGVKTEERIGLLKKAPCDPTQWIDVSIYDTDYGVYHLDFYFQSLGEAERYVREDRGVKWIFTKFDDVDAWLSKSASAR